MSSPALAQTSSFSASASAISLIRGAIEGTIRGKGDVVELALIALLSRGHLLIEDIPGVGKSTLARALAATVGGMFRRIQFTSDLLPADVVGVNVWRPEEGVFEFRRGPVFANLLLADELNRAPPRTQSALLEAMAEEQVSVDGVTYPLPRPFLVLATQNPVEHYGTYPLPESQRDRFALRVRMGYVEPQIEADLLAQPRRGASVSIDPVTTPEMIAALQDQVDQVFIHHDLASYAQAVVQATRNHGSVTLGVSTRGALAWVRAAQARALLQQRAHVSADDLQELAPAALAHRIVLAAAHTGEGSTEHVVQECIASVPVPR